MNRFGALLIFTFQRLLAQKGLTLATLLGLITAVSFITTIPLYADAVSFRVMEERLNENANRTKSPFAYMYRYVGAWHGSLQWPDIQPVDTYLTNEGSSALGLPLDLLVRHFETDDYLLYPASDSDYNNPDTALATIYFASTSSLADQITITEGQFPTPTADGPIGVMVTEPFATEAGLQVGDTFIAYNARNRTDPAREIPVQIVGIWQAQDPQSPFWFYAPAVFDELLIVPEETFAQRLGTMLEDEVHLAVWYLVMDGSRVGINDVNNITSRAGRVAREVAALLPNTSNETTPVDGLADYRRAVGSVTTLLTAASVPLVGLILAFIGLTVGLAVDQRRNEMAVLYSRGTNGWQALGFSLVEGLVLGVPAFGFGLLGGLGLTQVMGKVQSFLDFSAVSPLRVAITESSIQAGLVAVGLGILTQVIPTLAAARTTIISYKQEIARTAKRPWWQRAWLDVLFLIPVIYGLYTLQQQGVLTVGEDNDPLQNPLFLLLPALASLSIALFCLRLLPWLMELSSWALGHTRSMGLLLATRYLARNPGQYAAPFLLVVFTTSLCVFTASLAQTVDYQLFDEGLYRIGTDVRLIGAGMAFGGGAGPTNEEDAPLPVLFLPMDEYLELPGVVAATRIGRFETVVTVGTENTLGTFLGIDPQTFPQAAFWRYDFAPTSLGHLLNNLAARPDGVLVSRSFLNENGLRVGDFLRLAIRRTEGNVPLLLQVAGSLDYFPTWYEEEDGVLFIGNLEELFTQAGGDLPYEVWLQTSPTFDNAAFDAALLEHGLFGWQWDEPYTRINQLQHRPERQGLFGLLSVGFIAAALLTVAGFFLYAIFSFRRRVIELGVLQAVGLSRGQMIVLVGSELGGLMLGGLTLGTLVGSWMSQQFIPYLQTTAVPPYLVEIAWPAIAQVYIWFTWMFVIALGVVGVLLARMKIFQALKLGETV